MSRVDTGMRKWPLGRTAMPLLAVSFLTLAAGSVLSAPDMEAVLARIAAALSAGDGTQAVALSDTALAQPGLGEAAHSRLVLDRGLANQLLGNSDAALADLTEAINGHGLTVPEQARAFLERGLVLDGLNRLNDAIGDYGAVLRLTPNAPAALNNRANAYRRQNRFEDARRDYLASLASDNPAPEYPYYGLGQIAESQGNREEAKNFYLRALAANPGYILAAQRLTALGGTPPAPDVIMLRPPKGAAPPPAGVVLHPPPAKKAPFQEAEAPSTIKPAAYSGGSIQPDLRPALDSPAGQQVQLGAWRQEDEAAAGWNRAVKAADGALSGYAPRIVAVDLPGKGRYFRLRVVTADGHKLCAILTAKGLDCIPVKD
jgi:tetratricopeptide (TPR) repeat protein